MSVKPTMTRSQRKVLEAEFRRMEQGVPFQEDLPLPFVHYTWNGTFISFSDTIHGTLFICSCAQSAVENYIVFRSREKIYQNRDPLRMAMLDALDFGRNLAQKSLAFPGDPMRALSFKAKICHRCNMATPSAHSCHPMYGGQFHQKFGWYIKQTTLRIGVSTSPYRISGIDFLENTTPQDLKELIISYNSLSADRLKCQEDYQEREKLNINAELWPEKRDQEKRLGKIGLKISNFCENITREEFGFRKIGSAYVGETTVFNIVCRIFPEKEVVRHIRPDWLEGLELDIYIPEMKIGVEYQGQQHFHPIKAWGGEKALKAVQQRDQRKRQLCAQRGIHLVEIDYTEPLTEKYISEKIWPQK